MEEPLCRAGRRRRVHGALMLLHPAVPGVVTSVQPAGHCAGVTPARSVPAPGEAGIPGGTTRGKSPLSRRRLPASSGIRMESCRSGLWGGALLRSVLQASGVCLV